MRRAGMDKTVLAIDPGRVKCGVALVFRSQESGLKLLWHDIVSPDDLVYTLFETFAIQPFETIIIGGGTNSGPVVHTVREAMPSLGILVVDEQDTSLQARERYWEFNPRKGWRRFLPATLQVPPVPVDDYVAYILAERVLLGG